MNMSSGTQLTTMATDTHLESTMNEAGIASAASTTSTNAAISGQGHSSTKKKFGKNLNKLNAPPMMPVPQGGAKTNASAKNGLLLLSNKRTLSGKNAVATSSAIISNSNSGGGILSTKTTLTSSKPLPNLGLHTEYNPSTHDALMGVVVGASRMESQQQPDAWGVADKQHEVTRVDLLSPHHEKQETSLGAAKADESFDSVDSSEKKHGNSWPNDSEEPHQPGEFRSSNWDEYGGRGASGESNEKVDAGALVDTDTATDEQGAYMSKLAKERAERRRGEEETRILQQKERAAQRLRDLEDKIASKQITTTASRPDEISEDPGRQDPVVVASTRERSGPRKLFDPSEPGKSYSALVRGSSPMQDYGPVPTDTQNEQSTQAVMESNVKSIDPQSFHRNQNVIQLSSYDATDRGPRGVETGPRMLFDPKSGSMVEVSSRDDKSPFKKKEKFDRGGN
jgi:hypothetical protein